MFVAKGRDGKTDIWGIISRPKNFDPAKKYPVIEDIYAGPHGLLRPKGLQRRRRSAGADRPGLHRRADRRHGYGQPLEGVPRRLLAQHQGRRLPRPDPLAQAVGKKYPYYDLTRVGIYGTSAGGQNATAGMLFHPEFYKAAVSACGCHDNRMDKASWNEQWMGYPVGPWYSASSNIENAKNLRGKLLLIVGEMDTNVPPESTMRLVDALIKAGKDFELLVVPNANHGMGGEYGVRRMRDFFVRHLLGREARPTESGPRRENIPRGPPPRTATGRTESWPIASRSSASTSLDVAELGATGATSAGRSSAMRRTGAACCGRRPRPARRSATSGSAASRRNGSTSSARSTSTGSARTARSITCC